MSNSYAKVVKNLQDLKPNTQKILIQSTTVQIICNKAILDDYADREHRKHNIIFHNVMESTQDDKEAIQQEDCMVTTEMLNRDLGLSEVSISKTIRLGGRDQNKRN